MKKEIPQEHKEKIESIRKDIIEISKLIGMLSPNNRRVISKADRTRICNSLLSDWLPAHEHALYNLYIQANNLKQYFEEEKQIKK